MIAKCTRDTSLFEQVDWSDQQLSYNFSDLSYGQDIVYDKLHAYVEEHDIICKYHSGFPGIQLTVSVLLEATDTYITDRV